MPSLNEDLDAWSESIVWGIGQIRDSLDGLPTDIKVGVLSYLKGADDKIGFAMNEIEGFEHEPPTP